MNEEINKIISKNLFVNTKEEIAFVENKLECICLNTNSKEEKKYYLFIEKLLEKTNKQLSKNIDFVVVTNNSKFNPPTEELKNIFKEVKIINLRLHKKEDLYIPFDQEQIFIDNHKKIPDYGTKSGPNLLFFNSMKLLKDYNTTLLLETDCILSSDWLEKISNYVANSNGFLISGSTYDGGMYSTDNLMLTHINGVALYATGHYLFQSIMEHYEVYFLELVKELPNLAYDWGFNIFIKENLKKQENHNFWKFINRNYVTNKYIFNYCLKQDKKFCEKELMRIYNYAVLHKKS